MLPDRFVGLAAHCNYYAIITKGHSLQGMFRVTKPKTLSPSGVFAASPDFPLVKVVTEHGFQSRVRYPVPHGFSLAHEKLETQKLGTVLSKQVLVAKTLIVASMMRRTYTHQNSEATQHCPTCANVCHI